MPCYEAKAGSSIHHPQTQDDTELFLRRTGDGRAGGSAIPGPNYRDLGHPAVAVEQTPETWATCHSAPRRRRRPMSDNVFERTALPRAGSLDRIRLEAH